MWVFGVGRLRSLALFNLRQMRASFLKSGRGGCAGLLGCTSALGSVWYFGAGFGVVFRCWARCGLRRLFFGVVFGYCSSDLRCWDWAGSFSAVVGGLRSAGFGVQRLLLSALLGFLLCNAYSRSGGRAIWDYQSSVGSGVLLSALLFLRQWAAAYSWSGGPVQACSSFARHFLIYF